MSLSRRDLLKSAGAIAVAGASSYSSIDQRTAEDEYNSLKEKVDSQRKVREDNPGGTVFLGSVNSWERSFPNGILTDDENFSEIDEMLEKGYSPEEIAENNSNDLTLNGETSQELIEGHEASVKLVYFSEGEERPLENYAEGLKQAFKELEPPIEINTEIQTVTPDEEDREYLSKVSSEEIEGLEADLGLKEKYSDENAEPVFLVENDLLPEAAGLADYLTDVAFVELSDNEEWNQHVINHETGHSILNLPHNYHENGAMSYNPEAFSDSKFNKRSKMIVEALMNGKNEYDVNEGQANIFEDGEVRNEHYKTIKIRHTPSNIDDAEAKQDFFNHLETYIEQKLEFNMSRWTPKDYKHVENNSDSFDIAVYEHDDGSELEMKVGAYIEDMKFRSAS